MKEKVKALIEQRDLLRKLYAKTLMLDEEVLESSEDVQDVFMPKMLQIIEENLSNRNFTIKGADGQIEYEPADPLSQS